jgi:hypothetical protein
MVLMIALKLHLLSFYFYGINSLLDHVYLRKDLKCVVVVVVVVVVVRLYLLSSHVC